MVREISAGGVVLRRKDGSWWMAAIELPYAAPAADPGPARREARSKPMPVLCLPKGLVDPGEKPLEAALREVREETGITAVLITKLGDSKYVYVLRYASGRIDDVSDAMRIEVARARWVRLDDAPKLLAYGGEKKMARKAIEYVKAHPDL